MSFYPGKNQRAPDQTSFPVSESVLFLISERSRDNNLPRSKRTKKLILTSSEISSNSDLTLRFAALRSLNEQETENPNGTTSKTPATTIAPTAPATMENANSTQPSPLPKHELDKDFDYTPSISKTQSIDTIINTPSLSTTSTQPTSIHLFSQTPKPNLGPQSTGPASKTTDGSVSATPFLGNSWDGRGIRRRFWFVLLVLLRGGRGFV